jgi:hypothetical protein
MSGVALRCPTCGTTQSHPGECDACFDAEVRYFCSNHSPGLWIDGPVCSRCGAKFGDAPGTEPELPARSTPSVRPAESGRAESRPTRPGGVGRRPAPPSRSPVGDEWSEEEIPSTPSLADLLAAAMAERSRARHRAAEEVWTHSPRERPRAGLPVVGCLFRLVLFIVFLIVLVFGGWFVLLTGGSW